MVRHAASRAVSFQALPSTANLDKLKELLQLPDFDEQLNWAVESPTGQDGRETINELTPLLHVVGCHVKWAPLERASELPHLHAMVQCYGPHSEFVTFSQANSMQPLVIRMGSHRLGHNMDPGLLKEGEIIWSSENIS